MAKDGSVRVRKVVAAIDCGTAVNPDTVRAQIKSATIFGISAALHGEITQLAVMVGEPSQPGPYVVRVKMAAGGKLMQGTPAIDVHIVQSAEPPGGLGESGT